MSRFFAERYRDLEPYVPGEQPKDVQIVLKLNTNENPFPPSPQVIAAAAKAAARVNFNLLPGQMNEEKCAAIFGLRSRVKRPFRLPPTRMGPWHVLKSAKFQGISPTMNGRSSRHSLTVL